MGGEGRRSKQRRIKCREGHTEMRARLAMSCQESRVASSCGSDLEERTLSFQTPQASRPWFQNSGLQNRELVLCCYLRSLGLWYFATTAPGKHSDSNLVEHGL